ncbi:hypothetical protein EYC54_17460 [Xanthomonas oryzae]|uniref:hypothetical protein n=1 Tax=Xanthomonas oryzae TaxID=347 RepID=UPI001033BC3C|nr:hypothetical protein [Xanthomonas oryzae]QBG89132.1 hypothetical protein EYC54_17460 [Xanthomonas oryzae]
MKKKLKFVSGNMASFKYYSINAVGGVLPGGQGLIEQYLPVLTALSGNGAQALMALQRNRMVAEAREKLEKELKEKDLQNPSVPRAPYCVTTVVDGIEYEGWLTGFCPEKMSDFRLLVDKSNNICSLIYPGEKVFAVNPNCVQGLRDLVNENIPVMKAWGIFMAVGLLVFLGVFLVGGDVTLEKIGVLFAVMIPAFALVGSFLILLMNRSEIASALKAMSVFSALKISCPGRVHLWKDHLHLEEGSEPVHWGTLFKLPDDALLEERTN